MSTLGATEVEFFTKESYNPDKLLDTLIEKTGLKNDADLSRLLGVGPPMISKVRHRRLPVGSALLIRMHEETKMSIKELRKLMGDPCERLWRGVEGL